jgi:uncharacterized SAM-binding protein YcdF (DUF218 family)
MHLADFLFPLSKISWAVVEPGNLLPLLLGLGVLRLLVSGRRRGLGLVLAAGLAMLAVMLLPVAQWTIRPLENRFPTVRSLPEHVDGIILLGGAVDSSIMATRGQVGLNDAAERITETMALARRYPAAKIVLSGGSAAIVPTGDPSEAAAMRAVLVADGVAEDRLILEEKSRNTIENAEFSKRLANPKPGETWLLVTSSVHMPRAVGCFRRVNWPVLPFPVDYRGDGWSIDFSRNIGLLDLAVHEWSGLAYYRLLGRSDALLPAP